MERNGCRCTTYSCHQYARKRKTSLGRYYYPLNPGENLVKKIASLFTKEKAVITGSAGASLVASFADVYLVEIYTDKPPSRNLGLTHVERGENVRVYLPLDTSILEEFQTKDGVRIADNIQLYLDLMCNPRRGKEQANYLREQVIKFT